MPSPLFDRFLAGVNAPITWSNIDEYADIGALPLLTGDERVNAEDVLIRKLGEDDGRAANALADIGCTRAIPALAERAALSRSSTMRVFAARALLGLGDDSGRTAAIDVSRTADRFDRAAAVDLLAKYPGPETAAAVETALADPDATVRSSAISALLTLHGLARYDTSYRDVLGNIHGRMLSPLPSVCAEALAELRAVLARAVAGETPQRLGLTWHADERTEPVKSFADSLEGDAPEWAEDFALDGVTALTGRDRKWVEDMLLNYLPRDPRAVRAVAHLGIRRAIEPLRELLPIADDAMAVEIQAALHRLAGDP
jgi:HEAT repeat protein